MHLKFFKVKDINSNLSFNNDRALSIAKAGNHIHLKKTQLFIKKNTNGIYYPVSRKSDFEIT